MRRTLPLIALLLVSLLFGCEGMALHDAELADSPEAYESFLKQYPDSVKADEIRHRIEGLRFLRAKADQSSEAMRGYLALHPDGEHAEEARRLEDELSYNEAAAVHEPAAYAGYLDTHTDGAWVEQARFAHGQLTYIPKILIGEIKVEPVNMANDPKGPLNGYGVQAELTNKGDQSLRVVEVMVDYLGASGQAVQSDKWWVVAPDLGGFPTPPEMKPTMYPDGTRSLQWSTAEKPEGWVDGKFGVRVIRVEFRK
jgi:hypothetical protein